MIEEHTLLVMRGNRNILHHLNSDSDLFDKMVFRLSIVLLISVQTLMVGGQGEYFQTFFLHNVLSSCCFDKKCSR